MVSLPSEFRARLESYNGPLDLLLYLIKKEEVDIFDIPIAHIVDQYHLYLTILQEIDPNICGEFLVVAAHLMEIKSKLLLPREVLEDDEDLEDPRIELVRQLLEYKKYKERAMLLERRLEEYRRRYKRPPLDLPAADHESETPLPLGDVSVWDLFTAFHRIQIMLGQRVPIQVVVEERPVEAYIREVEETLQQSPGRQSRFDDLFVHARNRHEAIGYFLAILELAKQYLITLTQDEQFGPIFIRLRDEEEIRRLQQEALVPSEMEPAAAFLLEGEGAEAVLEDLPVDSDEERPSPGEDVRHDESRVQQGPPPGETTATRRDPPDDGEAT